MGAKPRVLQGVYWLLTIPHPSFLPYLPAQCSFITGQLESGGQSGYLHWQVLAVFKRSVRLAAVKSVFGDESHAELTRSSAANDYVVKSATSIDGRGQI